MMFVLFDYPLFASEPLLVYSKLVDILYQKRLQLSSVQFVPCHPMHIGLFQAVLTHQTPCQMPKPQEIFAAHFISKIYAQITYTSEVHHEKEPFTHHSMFQHSTNHNRSATNPTAPSAAIGTDARPAAPVITGPTAVDEAVPVGLGLGIEYENEVGFPVELEYAVPVGIGGFGIGDPVGTGIGIDGG